VSLCLCGSPPEDTMIVEARKTIRNVGLLMVQRGFHIIAGILFAILVPRMMGPDTYGRYALITSISLWFALISGLGAVPVMSHFVPQFVLRGDRAGLEKLVSNLLVLRMANGLLAAMVYLLLTSLWLRELDWAVLSFVAGSVFVRTGANLFFALFLGLNQAARWGMGEIFRRWASLIFLVIGFYLGGLRGGCFGLLLTEIVVFSVGLWWSRDYLRRSELRLDRHFLSPFLEFSILFFAGNLLMNLTQRSGETLVRLISGDYVQVGYYGVAYAIYNTAAHAVWQFTMAFAPLLTMLLSSGDIETLKQWVERLLKWMAIGGMLSVFGVLLLGDNLLPLVLGADFRPVTLNLVPLTLSLLTMALGSVGRLLALTYDRPWAALKAAIIHLVAFWSFGPPLVIWGGSLAGCLSILVASTLSATYFTWQMRADLRYSLRDWALTIFLGGLFLPLLLLRSSWLMNAALYGVFILGYGGLLIALRIVTLDEFTVIREALQQERRRTTKTQRHKEFV
jgi:O-antigen/teichoic acid export membrane protein